MHLAGEGVTRNFLTILEADVRRSAKSLVQVGLVVLLVFLVAGLALVGAGPMGFLLVPVVFVGGAAVSALYTRFFVTEAYEVSLRDNWNRWMRWSVSCKTVRECYGKVHDGRTGPSWWVAGLVLAGLLIAHVVLFLLSLNEGFQALDAVPVFALDAVLLGSLMGRRWIERRWYRKFLDSCNALLRDGSLGLWGVY